MRRQHGAERRKTRHLGAEILALVTLVILMCGCVAANLFLASRVSAAPGASQGESASPNAGPPANAKSGDGKMVQYPSSGDYQVEAYLAVPSGAGPHPAVIVIHENRGLDESTKDVARRFAAEGFVALAPDLLSPMGGTAGLKTPQAIAAGIRTLPLYGTVDDLKASFDYLKRDQSVDGQKISAVGFDWGGWRTFALASSTPGLYKAVVFYGSTPDDGVDEIKAPVLAHYAERDGKFTGQAVWTREQMNKPGKQLYQFFVYPDTDHDFFNSSAAAYDPGAAKLAWVRTLAFLRNQPLPMSVTPDKTEVKKRIGHNQEGMPVD